MNDTYTIPVMTEEKPPLLSIPPEIRLIIYGFVFASSRIRPCQNVDHGYACNQQAPNILLVNHQIRAEALPIFFTEGTFVIEVSELQIAFLSSLTSTQKFDFFKAPKWVKKIRNIIIEIYMDVNGQNFGAGNMVDQIDWIHDNMRSVCYALSSNTVLRNLEVSCWRYNSVSNRSTYLSGRPQYIAIPSLLQFTATFMRVAGPLTWLRVSCQVDLNQKEEMGGMNDSLECLKEIIESDTPAEGPSELEMMLFELKEWMNEYRPDMEMRFAELRGVPLELCLLAANAGDKLAFERNKQLAMDVASSIQSNTLRY